MLNLRPQVPFAGEGHFNITQTISNRVYDLLVSVGILLLVIRSLLLLQLLQLAQDLVLCV